MTGALTNAPRYDEATARSFRQLGYWDDRTLETFLSHWAKATPAKAAIISGEQAITYEELYARAGDFAAGLARLGLRKGDVVSIQLPNVPEFLIAYCGVALLGGVLSPMHMPYRAGELEPLLKHGGARAIICAGATDKYDAPAMMRQLKSKVPSLDHIIVVGESCPDDLVAFSSLFARGGVIRPEPPIASDWLLLNFTSGTSSAPKAVLRSYESLFGNARLFAPSVALKADDIVLSAPPFTHGFGLFVSNMTIVTGATNLLLPQYTPDALIERIANGRPSLIFAAPAHLATALKAGHFTSCDLSCVRDIVVGGSVCPPDIAAQVEDLLPGGRVGQLFGMTEAMLTMQTPLSGSRQARHCHTGTATPGVEIRVTDEAGNACPTGEEGELELRGYSVTPGYLNNPDGNRASFRPGGWFRTGDLATIDADGNVAITGRKKDLINRGSIKFNPTDLESLISECDGVVQAAIVPMPDPLLGEKACLFVTLAAGRTLTLNDVQTFLEKRNVAKLKWPERLEIIPEMPMTPTRKIIKGELQKKIAGSVSGA